MSNRPHRQPSKSARVQQARTQADRSRVVWIFGVAVVAVLAALLIAVFVTREGSEVEGGGESASGGTVAPSGNLHYGAVQIDGAPLPEYPGPVTADPAVGQPAPAAAGQTFDESAVRIVDDGTPKVVLFLAHWCPHCQAEVPRIQEWLDDNGMPTDVEVYSVVTSTTSTRSNFPPGDWLRREGWSVPTIVDDEEGTTAQAYGLSGFPYFVVIGADGNVVTRASGEITTAQWEALLEAARTGTEPGLTGGAESPA
jgi:cytochrome c biogenesis protein CcmG, thiol:disulfide interchange protein DsbE